MEEIVKTLKLVLILALIFGFIGAVLFFGYGFSIIWQGLAAGIIIGFLSMACILLVILASYLLVRTIFIQRELKKIQLELRKAYKELDAKKGTGKPREKR